MFAYILFFFLVVRLAAWVLGSINWRSFKLSFFNKKILNVNGLFENNFIDAQVLFATKFKELANISLVKYINASDAYALMANKFANEIAAVYQYNTFDHTQKQAFFNVTIFVLKNKRIIVLGYDYAEILYTGKDYAWANVLLTELANFKATNRTKVMGFANSEVMN